MDTKNLSDEILQRARQIKVLVLDVDGVMTDGKLIFTNGGEEIKTFNVKDGHGIKSLQNIGLPVAIITGRCSDIVARRAKELGIRHLIQGREDKLTALEELLASVDNVSEFQHIAYMGDDYPDLPVIRRVGFGTSPADGHWVVKQNSHWISDFNGGGGAVRQLCDLLMLAQGHFDRQLEPYL
ncbi:MAG: 3-deoxy-D-manno-octulosonate 8-phosphate phosphatase (KDO 8-P phosphatase) [Cellvibrionaceae bacterium]